MKTWRTRRAGAIALAAFMVFVSEPATANLPRESTTTATPVAERRSADNTFLTFTEWYLVYSPRELAAASGPPSSLPFFAHIRETWRGYWHTAGAIPAGTEANWGYHAMIAVIATSTTLEYAVRGIYERTIGRLMELLSGTGTCEDAHARDTAGAYAAFLDQEPWYKFDFWTPLQRVWSDCSVMESHPLRALERRYALSIEYAFKGLYAWFIGGGTQASYEPALPTTYVRLRSRDVRCVAANAPANCFEERSVARYQAFTDFARLISSEHDFVEIAGNNGLILVSMLAHQEIAWPSYVRPLFTQSSVNGQQRYAVIVDVSHIAELLRWTEARRDETTIVVEHIYDY